MCESKFNASPEELMWKFGVTKAVHLWVFLDIRKIKGQVMRYFSNCLRVSQTHQTNEVPPLELTFPTINVTINNLATKWAQISNGSLLIRWSQYLYL